MSSFDLIESTLIKENINVNQNEYVPKQFYFRSFTKFHNKISSYLNCISSKNNNIFILSDGNFKAANVDSKLDATELIIQKLNKNFIIDHKILSLECGVSPNEIHASEYFLNRTIQIINQTKKDSIFIALGSGTITDLLKHALFLLQSDSIFISIPTAMTVTAFTSSFSVIDINGAKRTRQSKSIDSTFWIEPLLQAAPIRLSRAGYGDLLARFVAYGDWYLSYKIGITNYYNELAYRLMEVFSGQLKSSANYFGEDILSSKAVETTASSLAMAGIAMSLCGETTPLSGYEHVISHALDFLRIISNRPLVLHGEQVALGALTSAMTFDWLIDSNNMDKIKLYEFSNIDIEKIINKYLLNAPFFGLEILSNQIDLDLLNNVKQTFINDYLTKLEKLNLAKVNFNDFQNTWNNTRDHLLRITMRSKEMISLLESAKLPTFPEATHPSTSALEYRWALRFAPFVRTRFCIADFIFWINEDTCTAAAI